MLGAYEDSDEEDSGNVRTSAANSQHNQSADIDSTLANFMAVSIIFSTFNRLSLISAAVLNIPRVPNICHKLFLLIFYQPQEIDAITTQPSSDQQSSLPPTESLKPQGNNKSAASEEQKQQSTEFEYNTQYSLATGESNGFFLNPHDISPLFTVKPFISVSQSHCIFI